MTPETKVAYKIISDWVCDDTGTQLEQRDKLVASIAQHITLEVQAAYERAAQAAAEECWQAAKAIRALGSASALELALAEAVEEEAKWWHMQRGHHGSPNWCCERIEHLRARIAALSGQPQEKDLGLLATDEM